MTRRVVGVVDYGAGNLASVARTVVALGHRCRVASDPGTLAATDVVVLPGVGAFPAAMARLNRLGLAEFLRGHARAGRPLVGICLGMQMLADLSEEQRPTAGLGLIPGRVRALGAPRWHIGWNTLEARPGDPLLGEADGSALYFNHAYVFDAPDEFVVARARVDGPFTAAVRRGPIVGLQFHPEKSQLAGRRLLGAVLEELADAR